MARGFLLPISLLFCAGALEAGEPFPAQVDALIEKKCDGKALAARAEDSEYLRRVYLDFASRIPTVAEARAFLADTKPDKRERLLGALLNGPEFAPRFANLLHVMLMERLGDHPEWTRYLQASIAGHKPWDRLAREMLHPNPSDPDTRGSAFFLAKRLENYGQNPVDYSGLTRDVGRLFLGVDLRCAECHDHLFIDDYKQADFKGLFAFFQNTTLVDPKAPAVGEKLTAAKLEFMSVFVKEARSTGPRIPGQAEIPIPSFKKGDEYRVPPDPKTRRAGVPKFSPLEELAKRIAAPESPAFARNIANRLWCSLMGRGLVHPLDLHHSANPPSHPELLDLLARELSAHQYDMKWFLGQIARTKAYERSSLRPNGSEKVPATSYRVALERRLSTEQLLSSILVATGEEARVRSAKDSKGPLHDTLRAKMLKAFANPAREPEDDHSPSLKEALFLMNDSTVLDLFVARPGNLVERLTRMNEAGLAEELYLAVLSRRPTQEEVAGTSAYLAKNQSAKEKAVARLAWALVASTEFQVNH